MRTLQAYPGRSAVESPGAATGVRPAPANTSTACLPCPAQAGPAFPPKAAAPVKYGSRARGRRTPPEGIPASALRPPGRSDARPVRLRHLQPGTLANFVADGSDRLEPVDQIIHGQARHLFTLSFIRENANVVHRRRRTRQSSKYAQGLTSFILHDWISPRWSAGFADPRRLGLVELSSDMATRTPLPHLPFPHSPQVVGMPCMATSLCTTFQAAHDPQKCLPTFDRSPHLLGNNSDSSNSMVYLGDVRHPPVWERVSYRL